MRFSLAALRPLALRYRRVIMAALAVLVLAVGTFATVKLVSRVQASGTDVVSDCSQYGTSATANTLGYWLAHYASGDTITFSCDGTFTFPATVTVSNTLTITGSGHAVIFDGGHTTGSTGVQLFNVSASGNLSLQVLTLQNGYISGIGASGGAVATHGTLTITDSTLKNNTSTEYAGALGNFAGTTTLTGDKILDNTAVQKGGGAIANDGTLIIVNSQFFSNTATGATDGKGGAISSDGPLTISTSSFSNNTATNGGAIANALSATATVTDSVVINGKANSSGGAFYNDGSSGSAILKISGTFVGSNISNGGGGAIFNKSGSFAIDSSEFNSNRADVTTPTGGGAIYIDTSKVSTITTSTFSENQSSLGGAIRLFAGALTISQSTFAANTATTDGGAIANSNALGVVDSTFTQNSAVKGGAIFGSGSVTLAGSLLAGDTGGECFSIVTPTGDYNLVADNSCGTGAHNVTGAANLGPLGLYGGNNQTVPLQNGSAALDVIPNGTSLGGSLTLCSTTLTDERGVARPQNGKCDIGAYEVIPPNVSISTPPDGATYVYGQAVEADYSCYEGDDPAGISTCVGTVPGSADIDTSVGPHPFTVTGTDGGGYAVTASTAYTVMKADTQATLSIPALTTGTPATLTVVVAPVAPGSGTPTGTVTLTDATSAVLGTATLSGGQATFSYTPTGTSSGQALTATYAGDSNFNGSHDTHSLSVQQGATTTALTGVADTVYGQSLSVSATVTAGSGTPTGTVTFLDGSTVLGTATLSSGTANFTITGLAVGTHHLAARYDGDTNYLTSSSAPQTQTVTAAPTTTTLTSAVNPTVVGQAVQLTAIVDPGATPTGTVTFLDGTTTLGTATLDGTGTAHFSIATLTAGTHHLTASYGATTNFGASVSAVLSQTVDTVTPPPATSTDGAVRFAQGTALASVDITIDGVTFFPNVSRNTVTSYQPLTAGAHMVKVFGPSGSGTLALTLPFTLPASTYLTIGLTGDATVAGALFTDDLSVAPQAAKVRVYDLAPSLGTLGVSLGGPSLTAPSASAYFTESPGTLTVKLTPSAGSPITDALSLEANKVYSIFVFDGGQAANAASVGIPTKLPQTGSTGGHGPNGWVIALLTVLALAGLGGGGTLLWRRTRTAR